MEQQKIDIPDNPYFTFVVDLLDVGLEIRVNDIPVFADQQGGEAAVEVAVNEYLYSGENHITLHIYKTGDEEDFPGHAVCNVAFCVRKKEEDAANRVALWNINAFAAELSTVDLNTSKQESRVSRCSHIYHIDKQSKEVVTVSSSVDIDYTFPQWAWINGVKIENNGASFTSLMETYRNIHSSLQRKDVDVLKNITKIKAAEFARAYHLPSEEDGESRVGLVDEINNDGQSLHDFWDKGMKLDVMAHGQLARIVDEDGDGPIVFLIGEGNAAKIMKLTFYKDEKNGWILVR